MWGFSNHQANCPPACLLACCCGRSATHHLHPSCCRPALDCLAPGGRDHLALHCPLDRLDCEKDALELFNVYNDPAYAEIVKELRAELDRTMMEIGDEPVHRFGSHE